MIFGAKPENAVYISDLGDDTNDGSSKASAVYSWERALQLADDETEFRLNKMTLERIQGEIAAKIAR